MTDFNSNILVVESSVCNCQHSETTVSFADDEKLLCITALNSHFTKRWQE